MASEEELRRKAQAALHRGDLDEAQFCLARLVKKNPRDHAAFAVMGEVRLARQDPGEAALCYMRAVNIAPQTLLYKERFVEFVGRSLATEYNQALANALVSCLKTHDLDCSKLVRFWASLLFAEPRFHGAYGLSSRQNFDPANGPFFAGLTDFRPLLTPLFLEGIKNLTIYEPLFEEFVTHLRGHLLKGPAQMKLGRSDYTALASAVAHYAFSTDFMLDVSETEENQIGALQARIEENGDAAQDAELVSLFACYRPLNGLANAQTVLENFLKPGPMRDLVQIQIADYFSLCERAAAIPSASPIEAGVSAKVREQYETFPYPRWKTVSKERLIANWLAVACNRNTEGRLRGQRVKILVAGCGTGRETAELATIFPDAAITAFDLSRTSLAYAASKARDLGLSNIIFQHGDILGVHLPEKHFDYVSLMGVLHHMADPVQGWRRLCEFLKPGGLMRIGLYSERARQAVGAAREAIAKGGYKSDRDGMLGFRRESPNLLAPETLTALSRFRDYYHLNMYRDLLFHVQEHRFDLPQIAKILKVLEHSFEGFYLPSETFAAYAALFPNDPAKTDLANWDAFEKNEPDIFMNMYVFWCRKQGA